MHTQRYEFQGLEVPVETWGSASETLVFLPGLGVHPKYYRPGIERLSSGYRIVVPDLSFRPGRQLPTDPDAYYGLVRAMADDLAPDAVWAGHSFGALLALRHRGPAIALAPSVPAPVNLPRMFARAVHQQLREYVGLEGWPGFRFAPQILFDYVGMAATRPGTIFPSISSLNVPASSFGVRSRNAVVYLCERDELYREHEYRAYLGQGSERIRLRSVADCHDWPIINPERLDERVRAAMTELSSR